MFSARFLRFTPRITVSLDAHPTQGSEGITILIQRDALAIALFEGCTFYAMQADEAGGVVAPFV